MILNLEKFTKVNTRHRQLIQATKGNTWRLNHRLFKLRVVSMIKLRWVEVTLGSPGNRIAPTIRTTAEIAIFTEWL